MAPPSQGLLGCLSSVVGVLRTIKNVFFGLSLQSYFFWSFLFYIFAGIWCMVSRPAIKQHLCEIDPAMYGCKNCTDKLLGCGKSVCFQYSLRQATLSFGLSQNNGYAPVARAAHLLSAMADQTAYEAAVSDGLMKDAGSALNTAACNTVVAASNSVVELALAGTESIRKQAAGTELGPDDVGISCGSVVCLRHFYINCSIYVRVLM